MRHLGQVVDERPAFGVLAEEERQLGLRRLRAAVAAISSLSRTVWRMLVGHLDADGVLARKRRDDADARHLQVQREVVGEGRDLVEAQAGFQGDLVLRDDRAGVDADDVHVRGRSP